MASSLASSSLFSMQGQIQEMIGSIAPLPDLHVWIQEMVSSLAPLPNKGWIQEMVGSLASSSLLGLQEQTQEMASSISSLAFQGFAQQFQEIDTLAPFRAMAQEIVNSLAFPALDIEGVLNQGNGFMFPLWEPESVRPSSNGATTLEPEHLWLTQEKFEKALEAGLQAWTTRSEKGERRSPLAVSAEIATIVSTTAALSF